MHQNWKRFQLTQIGLFSKIILKIELLKWQFKMVNFTAFYVKKRTAYILAIFSDSLMFTKS